MGRLLLSVALTVAAVAALIVAGVAAGTLPRRSALRALLGPVGAAITGRATVEERVAEYGSAARARLAPWFERAGVRYPPRSVLLAGFKQEKRLDLYAGDEAGELSFIRSYPLVAASGRLGPKLVEGDRQVPEGLYHVAALNPNSHSHLALRLDYPNSFDRVCADEDGRGHPGGDIMIHGATSSRGCLALGNAAIEELFVLVAEVGQARVSVVLSPVDLRAAALPAGLETAHSWAPELYAQIRSALSRLPAPDLSTSSVQVQDGDIIFHTSRSLQSVAIQRATGSKYSHVGIILFRDGKPLVLEAVATVRYTPLQDWIHRGRRGRYVVKRLRWAANRLTRDKLDKLRRVARSFVGRPYDHRFEWSSTRLYCSELVWKIYQQSMGIELGALRKLGSFRLDDRLVRRQLQRRYRGAVPLDEPVISPGEMFESADLETVMASP